jgi:hypothetical protein
MVFSLTVTFVFLIIRLKLIIAMNGPDSDRLPSAHTCLIFHIFVSPDPNGLFLNCYIRLSYYLVKIDHRDERA